MFEQGSKEWLSWRNTGIGASDAPVICGLSPWKDIHTLWLEKTGQQEPPNLSDSFPIKRGNRVEPIVRELWTETSGKEWMTALFQHDKIEYLLASLDGWDGGTVGLEIKVPGKDNHFSGRVPDHYWVQIQQQIFVANLSRVDYLSYYLAPKQSEYHGLMNCIPIYPSKAFMEIYLPLAATFWECVKNKEDPRGILNGTPKLDLSQFRSPGIDDLSHEGTPSGE